MAKGKELETRLQRTEQQLGLFQKISRFMVRELSLQEVLQGVVSLVVEFTQCDSCLVYLLDGEELVLCASNTPHPSTIGKVRMRWNEGLTGWVARELARASQWHRSHARIGRICLGEPIRIFPLCASRSHGGWETCSNDRSGRRWVIDC